MMIPHLDGGLFVLVRPRTFPSTISSTKKERKREKTRGRNLPFLSLSLSTHLYFSISPSLSLSLESVYIFVTSPIWVLSLLSSRILFFNLLYFLALCGLQLLVKMMKRARRVVMDSSPSSSHLPVGEEARARFKHQALLQDFEELLRETEAKKRKLQKTMQKKLKLTAEVKFLRRKYNIFARNPSQETPCRLKKLPCKKPSPLPSATFARPQNSINNDSTTCALFDLNKVSFPNAEEIEGIQVEWEPLKVDKLKRCLVDGKVVAHDLNLSIFKDVGNGSRHVGKRKISWKDQVALRV